MDSWRDWPVKYCERESFPSQLKSIHNCPKGLYYRGEWSETVFDNCLAIVGSRNVTRYGREVLSRFIPDFVANKFTTISGFMYGVDTIVHQETVSLGGVTIAVLGGGLDQLVPTENGKLYSEILSHGGLVISEYENDFKPTLWSFPQRNRIVSGLASVGVLVVEAGIKSGSLITAKYATRQGKKLFAVPGHISSKVSEGTNWLIKTKQAELVSSSSDITNSLATTAVQENLFLDNISNNGKLVLSQLSNEEMSVDELAKKLKLPVVEILVVVSELSMKNMVSEETGKIYLNRL